MIVGVLRGGTSSEYNLSLKTGAAMMAALPEDRYQVRDIFIGKDGLWHSRGTPSTPARALAQVDVVLNGLHGGVGEDGTVQRILEKSGVPYAGSRPLASSMSLNKIIARDVLQKIKTIKMPRAVAFSSRNDMDTALMAQLVFCRFAPPYVVKPPSEGASYGIKIAGNIRDLPNVLAEVIDQYGSALVEEYIRGRHASVGVIERFRNQEIYALPPAYVMIPNEFHMQLPHHHEEGSLRHIVPSDFSHNEKDVLMHMAKEAHRALQLSHFSRADFVVAPPSTAEISRGKPRVYMLEVNSIPGLYPGASFPPMLKSVGSSVGEFLEHSIKLARGAA